LSALAKLPHLQHLSLAGIALKAPDLNPLTEFPQLRGVYIWNTGITNADIEDIKKKNAKLHFETGVNNESIVLKLNPPVLETEERIINGQPLSLKLKHFIKGAEIRYTTDGSIPDSNSSAVYKDSVVLNKAAVFKAKAFKKGWLGSDSISVSFFKNSYKADSIRSLTPLDSTYKGKLGAKTLINGEKGGFNFGDGKWLGFRKNRMEMILYYNQPVSVSSVSLSTLVDIGGYIMPPVSLEVWGGITENKLVRLGRIVPVQPLKMSAGYMQGYECVFKTSSIKYLKLIAVPVPALPAWHPAKGQKGWIFTDEIFVN